MQVKTLSFRQIQDHNNVEGRQGQNNGRQVYQRWDKTDKYRLNKLRKKTVKLDKTVRNRCRQSIIRWLDLGSAGECWEVVASKHGRQGCWETESMGGGGGGGGWMWHLDYAKCSPHKSFWMSCYYRNVEVLYSAQNYLLQPGLLLESQCYVKLFQTFRPVRFKTSTALWYNRDYFGQHWKHKLLFGNKIVLLNFINRKITSKDMFGH